MIVRDGTISFIVLLGNQSVERRGGLPKSLAAHRRPEQCEEETHDQKYRHEQPAHENLCHDEIGAQLGEGECQSTQEDGDPEHGANPRWLSMR